MRLMRYRCKVVFVLGKLIAMADAFSHAPLIEKSISNILSVAEVLSEKCSVQSLTALFREEI